MTWVMTVWILVLGFLLAGCSENSAPSKSEHSTSDYSLSFGEGSIVKVGRDSQKQIQIRVEKSQDPDGDLFRAQGYETASERFVQMDILRRAATARLAELYGKKFLDKDKNVISVGLLLAIEKSEWLVAKRFPEEYRFLEAYAEGVNRFLSELEKKNPNWHNYYQRISGSLSYKPEPWTVRDSIGMSTAMAFHLSSSIKDKALLSLAQLALALKPHKMMEFLDIRPIENATILRQTREVKEIIEFANNSSARKNVLGVSLEKNNDFRNLSCKEEFSFPMSDNCTQGAVGSNNWVISRKFAGGKQSFVANDPHLQVTFPGLFYEIALDSTPAGGTFRVRGVNVPGLPGVMIGHNEHFAWGFTNSMSDVDELYLEYERGENGVLFNKSIVRLKYREYEIRVKDHKTQKINLRIVPHHGPIISDHFDLDGDYMNIKWISAISAISVSYRWAGHDGGAEIVSLFRMNRATNFSEFKEALKHVNAGAQNVVYADKKGNIGYYSHGAFPVRPYASVNAPPFLVSGGGGRYEWQGFRTKFPELYNPEEGYIVTANNDPHGYNQGRNFSDFHDYFGYRFDIGARAARISYLIEELKKTDDFSLQSMGRIQYDHKDLMAERFITLIQRVSKQLAGVEGTQKKYLDELLAWNGGMSKDAVAPVLYHAFLGGLLRQYATKMVDEQVPANTDKTFPQYIVNNLVVRAGTPIVASVYNNFRDSVFHAPDVAVDLVRAGLNECITQIVGKNVSGRSWGDLHVYRPMNPLPGFFPNNLVVPALARDGSWATVDLAGFDFSTVLDNDSANFQIPHSFGPVFRLVMAIGEDEITGVNVVPGGMLGRPDDHLALRELMMWRDGEQRPLVRFLDS